jgi:prepilin-type N-terminal cleavage/methylation domain-containing protein
MQRLLSYYLLKQSLKERFPKRCVSSHIAEKHSQSFLGFTLIELLVVIVIAGVLAGIAAPAWLAFTNRQRLSTATNNLYTALKSVQSEAKRDKRPKTITIDVTNRKITAANVGQESFDNTIQITGVTENNPAATIVSSGTATILFDEKGNPFKLNTSVTPNIRTRAIIPIQIKLKHNLIGQEQCITIRTLLGSVDTNCSL